MTFDETKKFFKNQNKLTVTGTPLREELFKGDAVRGKTYCEFKDDKKIILIIHLNFGKNKHLRNFLMRMRDRLLQM